MNSKQIKRIRKSLKEISESFKEEKLFRNSHVSDVTATKKQVPKTNTVIRNLRVLPEENNQEFPMSFSSCGRISDKDFIKLFGNKG